MLFGQEVPATKMALKSSLWCKTQKSMTWWWRQGAQGWVMGHRPQANMPRAHLEAPALPWSLPMMAAAAKTHQSWGTRWRVQKPLERWPPPSDTS